MTVEMRIDVNPGIAGLRYDFTLSEGLELTGLTKGVITDTEDAENTLMPTTSLEQKLIIADSEKNNRGIGTLVILTVKVRDDVAAGAKLTISAVGEDDSIFDVNFDNVPHEDTPCTITVAGGGETPTVVPVTGVTLSGEGLTSEEGKYALLINEGDTATLTATVDPENATDKTVTWSADEGITVNNGVITTQIGTLGKFTVTAKAGEQTAVCEVTVKHANLQKVGEQPASCTEAGQKAHWFCDRCGLHYLIGDNDTVGEETASVIIPKLPHTLKLVAEKAATCTTGGNVAYWKCSVCGAMFKDANGSEPTNEEGVKTPANGHSYSSEWSKDANYHWHECTVCQEKEPGTENPHDWKVVVKKDYAEGSPTHEV